MFRPSINGYSISALKTMPGSDGLVIRCNLLKEGKKIGECFDGGYGGEMELYCNGVSESAVHKEIGSWGKFKNYQFDWNVGLLVEELMNLSEDYKLYKNALKDGYTNIATYSEKNGNVYVLRTKYDEPKVMSLLNERGADDISFYGKEADFTVVL